MTDMNTIQENVVEEEDKSKELDMIEKLVRGDDSVPFEHMIEKKRFGSKFWLNCLLVVFFIGIAALYKYTIMDNIVPGDVLYSALDVYNIDTKWIVKETINEKDFKGVVIVPQLTFQFRNKGKVELKNVSVLAIFKVATREKPLGEASLLTFRSPLAPGAESEIIKLVSDYGYKTISKEAFSLNSEEWKSTTVEVFVKCGGNSFVPLRTYFVSKNIDGIKRELKFQFK